MKDGLIQSLIENLYWSSVSGTERPSGGAWASGRTGKYSLYSLNFSMLGIVTYCSIHILLPSPAKSDVAATGLLQ